MGNLPSKPGPAGTKFRVIGAGMSRTGTKTLNEALTILLGGPVHDSGIQSLGGSIHQMNRWLEIMELAPKVQTFSEKKKLEYLLADILDGYVATVDCPAVAFTPELMELYPEAVVIVTTRDEKSWWKSMEYMQTMMSNWYLPWVVLWLPKLQVYGRWRELFRRVAEWRWGERMLRPETLRRHEDHLRAVVPKEKLHFYRVSEGWEPLCKILNVPVPDRQFPHNNTQGDARKVFTDLMFMGLISWAFVLGLLYAMYWFFLGWTKQT